MDQKHILVVGGGISGITSAIEIAEVGHRVTLVEAEAQLGGLFRLAAKAPGRQEAADILKYFEEELERLGKFDVAQRIPD